jgi:hypothetical protein
MFPLLPPTTPLNTPTKQLAAIEREREVVPTHDWTKINISISTL